MDLNVNNKKVISACLGVIISCAGVLLLERTNRKRKWWVKPWLNRREGNIPLPEKFIQSGDTESYSNFLRMNEETFQKLLAKIETRITKMCFTRECIPAKDKLVVTLRYLATGESYRSLMYSFRISESTISIFIPSVCRAIYEELKDEYLKTPNSAEFETQWNIPNVIGAMDGKHILLRPPGDKGSAFYNYKGTHSIILLALVDANYNFKYINVGMNGRISDGGVYWESNLSVAIERNLLNIPEDKVLPGRTKAIPHVILADAAFTLSQHIMKPYPFRGITRSQRIFNYRLSRARRVVENAFGILSNRFRILLNVNPLSPEKVKTVTQACCVLHNFLAKESKAVYLGANPEDEIDRRFRFLYGLAKEKSKRPKTVALKIREEFEQYFSGCGAVDWQNEVE